MTPVFQAPTLPEAELVRQRLAQAGIEAVVRNQHLQGAMGELPANLYPEVCIMNEADFDQARDIVGEMEQARRAPDGPDVTCPACGETNPSNFEICWKCGKDLPES